MSVLFIAPVTPLLQCDPNPTALTKRTAIIFMRMGTRLLCPSSSSKFDAPLPLVIETCWGVFSSLVKVLVFGGSPSELFESLLAIFGGKGLRDGNGSDKMQNQIRYADILYWP